MCIIVAKNKGVKLPTKHTLQQCFLRNSDGAGLMYVKNNKVIIEKGFMTFEDLWHKIKELKHTFNSDLTDKALILHFRIGTHGENDKETTHPFPISNNAEDLRKTYIKTDIGMAHNGIIYDYNYHKVLSDTQTFIKDYVSVFKELNKNFYKNERAMRAIAEKANTYSNKLCFLDKDENIYWYGNKVVEDGIIYSNETFKQPKPIYKTFRTYGYDYDYYDYDYGYDYDDVYYKKVNKKTLNDLVNKNIKYKELETGTFYQNSSGADIVEKNETIIIDSDRNLYEKREDNTLSLIGTNTTIYDKNWNVKELVF